MKRSAVVLALLAALTLTGCTAAPDTAPSEPEDATESAEPLAAETPTEAGTSEADTLFLTYVRDNLLPETQIPDASDEQLIAAGHVACEQLESGVALEAVRVVEGEQPHKNGNFYDTSAIMNGALKAYCPDAA